MPFDNPDKEPFGDLEILIDTRGRIRSEDAWIQGKFEDGQGRCLVAALSLACQSRSFDVPNQIERRLAWMIAKQLPPDGPWWIRIRLVPARRRLMSFNDDPRTKHADVVALIDRTIERLMCTVPQYEYASSL